MCFHSQQSASAKTLENRFKAAFDPASGYVPAVYNGFTFPLTPVITQREPARIQMFHWGLIPHWAKDESIRKNTLNARIESVQEKPSFREASRNHCLVLADAFFEWQWLNAQGTRKQKYKLCMPQEQPFAFAGIYSIWVNKNTGEEMPTYAILTMEANALMSTIHNTKKRMPLILSPEGETSWLAGGEPLLQNDLLTASPV